MAMQSRTPLDADSLHYFSLVSIVFLPTDFRRGALPVIGMVGAVRPRSD
jgi:hypothetical protein